MIFVGKLMEYRYTEGDAYSVKFEEESCTWTCMGGPSKGLTGTESYSAVEVAPNVLFVSWVEDNGEVVSLVVNLDTMKIFCSYLDPEKTRHQWEGDVSYWGEAK